MNFLFALGKAYEDRGEFDHAWAYYREGNSKQRASVSYDPVQTESMNDRLVRVFDRDFLQLRRGEGVRGSGTDFHTRAAALGIDLARAGTCQPQPGRGHERAALPEPRGGVAQSQPGRRHQLPRSGA